MRLLELLTALYTALEVSRTSITQDVDDQYYILSKRFTELAEYKSSDDAFVPGVRVNEVKRSLKASSNTYYSIYSGVVDDEINRTSYNRQLGILAVQVSELIDTVKQAYDVSCTINSIEASKKASSAVEATVIEASADPQKVFKDFKEMGEGLGQAQSDIDKAEQADVYWLRQHQHAPATPEGYRILHEKNSEKADPDPIEAEKQRAAKLVGIKQDDSQVAILKKYQPGLQELASTTPTKSSDWVIGKGPVFFSSNPPLNDLYIKKLKYKYDPFFPGYILADQFLLGIKPSLLQDKKELLVTLRHIQKALSQRFSSGFVYMAVPDIKPNAHQLPPERTKSGTPGAKQVKEEVKVEIPKFLSLPGSRLVWTWILLEEKYNSLPRIKVKDFGFPNAPSLRGLDERLTKRIVPELKDEALKRDEVLTKYRLQIEQEYAKQSAPLKVKLEETKEKIKTIKATLEDLAKEFARETLQLDELKHDLTMAATSALREKLNLSIKTQEDKMSVISGRVSGHKAIVKSLVQESTALKTQMAMLLSNIRKEEAENLRKYKQSLVTDTAHT